MEFTINKISEIVGISAYTLRYYEKEGLIRDILRDKNGVRKYTEDDIHWIEMIKCLKNTGMNISDIKSIVDLEFKEDKDKKKSMEARKSILLKHKKILEEERLKIDSYLEKIDKKIEFYDSRKNCSFFK